MSFNPKSEYTIVPTEIGIKDFLNTKKILLLVRPIKGKLFGVERKNKRLWIACSDVITFQN
nr:hypothetical protein [Flavobacterium phycosphaerae]